MSRSSCACNGRGYVGERARRTQQDTSVAEKQAGIDISQGGVVYVGGADSDSRSDRHAVRATSNSPPPAVGVGVTSVLDVDRRVSSDYESTCNCHRQARASDRSDRQR